jgi:peptidoglycan/LPS O-acetylase OafA/YrhL
VFDFILGALMAKLIFLNKNFSASNKKRRMTMLCVSSALTGLAVLLTLDTLGILKSVCPFLDYLRESHLYAPLIALLLYGSVCRPATLSWFASPFAYFFGDRSYAIYLSQFFGPMIFPLLSFATISDHRWVTAWLKLSLLTIVLFAIVEIMHRVIDTPVRRALRTLLTAPRRTLSAVALRTGSMRWRVIRDNRIIGRANLSEVDPGNPG